MQNAEASADYLVVVGASAGGIEALSTLGATLPADFRAPLVIAQHLDPTRHSQLAEILAHRGRLPVRAVQDREPLRAGVIYVVPADRQVAITDHEVLVLETVGKGPWPSVDLLFRSAAGSYGERLIAVVLTGSASDGAAGAEAVKAAGGMVIIQNPTTARFPSMPASLAPVMVDIVSDLERIGPLLHDLVRGSYLPVLPDDETRLRHFLEQVRERSGMDFTSYKMPTIRRRLQRRMAAMGIEHLADYLLYVEQHPDEYQRLVNSFLIKVAEFFRDHELFDYLRERVIPELIARAEDHGRELRVWSAGCATGQEAYSLAMLVADALGDRLADFNVRIFATDLDESAIKVARRGIYPRGALDHVPPEIVERHFTLLNGMYEVNKRIRALTVFGQHDLGQRAPFPRIDLCVCRNVLIYFTADLQVRALQLFAFSLHDGGYLVLGKSETTRQLTDLFRPVQPHLKIYRRQGERLRIPSALSTTAMRPTALEALDRRSSRDRDPAPQQAHTSREDLVRCLLALPIGVIVVNRRYDIQILNGAAGRLLGFHDVAIGQDLLHLARDLSSEQLRALIDAAFDLDAPSGDTSTLPGDSSIGAVLETYIAGRQVFLRIDCYPYPSPAGNVDEDKRPAVLLLIADATAREIERQAAEASAARQQIELAAATAQIEGLAEINRGVLVANQHLTTLNIELRTTNEEASVDTEEAQAATKEVETINEELQASNEELETLNEELQATVGELKTTNDEIQARGVELVMQAAIVNEQRQASEAEQARLTAILANMDDAVLVVDPQGNIVLTNPSYDHLFGAGLPLILEDAGGQPLPPEELPMARAVRGEVFSMHGTRTGGDGLRRRFEAHGAPVRGDGALQWSVVVIRDISERSLRQLREEFLSGVSHELQTPLTAIRAGLGLLELGAGNALGPAERELLDAMRRNAERLRLLVNDLLAARSSTALTPIDREPLDLRGTVASAVAAIQPLLVEKKQLIELDLPQPLPVVGDARLLEQVLVNLLANAYRHTPADTRILVAGHATAEEARLVVRDTGPGIPADELEAIFERFYRASRATDGAGLGLAIARNLAGLHGGRLWAESREGQGAAFHLVLPHADSAGRETP